MISNNKNLIIPICLGGYATSNDIFEFLSYKGFMLLAMISLNSYPIRGLNSYLTRGS